MSEIHLQVVAGLANRLRALISGICLAEDYNLPLIVHWTPDHACGAHFDSLFDMNSLPSFVSISKLPLLKAYPCLSPEDLEYVKIAWDRKLPLVLKSYGHFHTSDMVRWVQHLRSLKATTTIVAKVEERLPPFDQTRFVGVHIRRGDNVKSIQASPLTAFLKRLEREDGFFIVATDDEGVKQELQKRFEGRVWFPAHLLDRNSEEGIQEALIDFLSLARCPTLLGSVYSSFSEIAGLYGGCTIEFVKG